MIYTPNMAVVAPSSGAWYGGDGVDRMIAHPALLFVPAETQTSVGSVSSGNPIPGDLLTPPVSVVAVMYAAKWRVEIDIIGPGGALEVTREINASRSSWWEVLSIGNTTNADEGHPGGEIIDFTRVQLSLGTVFIRYFWGDPAPDPEGWWPGLLCLVTSTRRGRFDPPSPEVSVQGSVSPVGGHGSTSIIVDVAGDEFPLYYTSSGQSGLSGTIRLVPIEWLDVV